MQVFNVGDHNDWILGVLIDIDPALINDQLSSENIITLNINIGEESRLATLFFLAMVFNFIMRKRQANKAISMREVHAMLLANVSMLKKTMFTNEAKTIENDLNFDICL